MSSTESHVLQTGKTFRSKGKSGQMTGYGAEWNTPREVLVYMDLIWTPNQNIN